MTSERVEYSKYLTFLAFLLILFITYLIARPFFSGLIWAFVLGYLFYPAYLWLKKYLKNPTLSSAILILFICLIILVPIFFLVNTIIIQTIMFFQTFNPNQIIEIVKMYLNPTVLGYLTNIIQNLVSFFVSLISNILLSLPSKLINILIMLFTLFFIFKDGDKIQTAISKIEPFEQLKQHGVFEKMKNTTSAIIYGLVLVAFLEAIFAFIGFYIFGVNAPFFWAILILLAGVLPGIGPSIIYGPIAVYLMYTNKWAAGIGLLIYSIIILSIALDWILRTKFISDKGKIHPITALIGVLGGISIFGFTGIVLGPLILALFILWLKIIFLKK